jgi:hypothetical protein
VSTHPADNHEDKNLEISVEAALRRARPLPPYPEMVIEDLTEEEAEAFFESVNS